ncbi:MAG: 4Fe-4S dicluster domain-containing protein [Deltaproteobacteria bacterium]|nr:4Fe-4S dicluster domain-containing protein [Deltaproteobacteria bacterium]
MSISRRDFIRIAGLSTLFGLGARGAYELIAPGQLEAKSVPEAAATGKRWAMVVDMHKVDADTARKCAVACHRLHNVPDFANPVNPKYKVDPEELVRWEVKWIWTDHFHNTFPGLDQQFQQERLDKLPFLVLCNHCENPACVRVCPTQATFRREDGVVMMDMHRCIGCRYCMAACPYGARSFNWRDPRPYVKEINPDYPTRELGVVEKCTFCVERLEKNLMPACVVESKGALIFGDLNNPKSTVRQVLRQSYTIRRKPHLGTNPQVYYIV